jgi:hypothetical protein
MPYLHSRIGIRTATTDRQRIVHSFLQREKQPRSPEQTSASGYIDILRTKKSQVILLCHVHGVSNID